MTSPFSPSEKQQPPLLENQHTTTMEVQEEEATAAAVAEEVSTTTTTINNDNNNNNDTTTEASLVDHAELMRKKRQCRFPGCNRVIKSQGHCQRHGAKAKRCRVEDCDKQAQGTHDGMCKRHWKQAHCGPDMERHKKEAAFNKLPDPEGESVYDKILPASIQYRPSINIHYSAITIVPTTTRNRRSKNGAPSQLHIESVDDYVDEPIPEGITVMPLVQYLRENAHQPPGWHRNKERRARGLNPVPAITTQLEPWERQLAFFEVLLMSGGTPYANFKDLAHAWGREKGFHTILSSSLCDRRGEFERKRRCDAGRGFTDDEKEMSPSKKSKNTLDTNTISCEENTVSGLTTDQSLDEGSPDGPELVQV